MIVVLDTNVFHGDVEATRQQLSALFSACDEELLDIEIWTPSGVVDELVRQYPEKIKRVEKVLASVERELDAFKLRAPEVPSAEGEDVERYRERLAARLTASKRKVADHPKDSGRIVEWAASRRRPIRAQQRQTNVPKGEPDLRHFQQPKPLPVYGVVDAAIWLTIIEAATQDSVAFISANTKDFSDPEDPSRPCPLMRTDLEAGGANPDSVEIFLQVFDFNQKFVKPLHGAQERATRFLADEGKLEALKAEIAEATEWYPLSLDDFQVFEVAVDDATLQSIDIESIDLKRADPAPNGLFATVDATGRAQIELVIRKADAYGLSENSDISVWDWDWNESMVAAEVERELQMVIEVRLIDQDDDGEDVMISIDEVELL